MPDDDPYTGDQRPDPATARAWFTLLCDVWRRTARAARTVFDSRWLPAALAIAAVLCAVMGWRVLAETNGWHTTTGQVVEMHVESSAEDADIDTTIRFTVGGVEHRFRSEYHDGTGEVEVTYDPTDPTRAYTPEDRNQPVAGWLTMALLCAGGACVLGTRRLALRKRRGA